MAVKADESSAVSRKRQEAERLAGPTWKAVSYALGGLLVLVAGLVFWLGVTLGEMGVSIENNAKAIENNAKAIARLELDLENGLERLESQQERGQERLESGLDRLENILIEFLRQRNGGDG